MVVAVVDDSACLADGTRVMEMTLTSSTASVCLIACPHWRGQTGSRRADRWGRLLLRSHRDEGVDVLTSRPGFHSLTPTTWSAMDVGENNTYGIPRTPTTVGGGEELRKEQA